MEIPFEKRCWGTGEDLEHILGNIDCRRRINKLCILELRSEAKEKQQNFLAIFIILLVHLLENNPYFVDT